MEAANHYLETTYIPQHNARYTRAPRNPNDIHKRDEAADFNTIFALICQRKVRSDWTIQYNNRLIQLDNSRPAIVKPKDSVTVRRLLDGRLAISIRAQSIEFKEIVARQPMPARVQPSRPIVYVHKPAADHPWRRYGNCL